MSNGIQVIGLLQNAWSPLYAGDVWPRESWLKALRASRSGLKLAKLEDAAGRPEIWYDNTTPMVGGERRSILPPDIAHVSRLIETIRPKVLIAFGKQAQAAATEAGWIGRTLSLPHPAVYQVGYKFMAKAGKELRNLLEHPFAMARTEIEAVTGGEVKILRFHNLNR